MACCLIATMAVAQEAAVGAATQPEAATSATPSAPVSQSSAPVSQPSTQAARHAVRHRTAGMALDERVQLMTRELGLDALQQAELKNILLNQRAEVMAVWDNTSAPAALRISATQAISEKTADRIRAMLSDAQREKYIKSRPHDTPVGAPGGDLQKWMTATQGH
ncbi:MAG: hypothetical protein JSR15_13345 [Proteobacteria bacterium]|nr:hypothetical protein [Pseudomonadota bacterium]